jgi:hypothetical protein
MKQIKDQPGVPLIDLALDHTNILVRKDRKIAIPADLKGKRVWDPKYQETAVLWSRGIIEYEFGLLARDIEWFMKRGADKSHGEATGFQRPPSVRLNQIPRQHQCWRNAGSRRFG